VVTQAPNCKKEKEKKKAKKDKNFGSNAEIFEVSPKNSAAAEMSNRYNGSRITPHVDLNEIVQYLRTTQSQNIICTGSNTNLKGIH
jgi:hypothetical protein